MRSFREISEKAGDTAVFTFGRFNPPTIGHEKLINAVAKQQKKNSGSKMYVYASQSNDPKKNPLPYAKKIAYMRKMFKKYAKNIISAKPRTAIEVAVELHNKGHRAIVMVVGSDRVAEFDKLLNDYNGVDARHGYYGFDNIEVVSAGERDPDAEGVEGMSASKMRAAAEEGDFDSFKTGIPNSMSDADKKKMYLDVRKGMGMREEREMGDDYDSLRDAYLTGKIWNVGESIEAKGLKGEVVRKGTNYLSFVTEDGKVHKAWLHEIELDENEVWTKAQADGQKKYKDSVGGEEPLKAAKSPLQRLKDFDKSRVAAGKPPIFTDRKPPKFVRMKKAGMMTIMNVPTPEIDKFMKRGYKIIEERDYKKEYANYQGKPEQIERRSSRNKARRAMGDKAVKGMDVGHKDNNPMNNDPKNLRNEDPSKNRREPRLREKRDAGYPDDSEKIGKKHYIIYKDRRDWYGFEVDKDGNQIGDSIFDPKKDELKKMILRFQEDVELDERLKDQIPWLRKAISKIHQMTHPKGYEKLVKQYADGMRDKKNREHPSAWASDIARDYKGVEGRDFVKYINKLVDQGKLPKELKAEYQEEETMQTFSDLVKQINEVKQDKDVDDKKGTQPAKYYAGDMAKSTKDKRDAHFKAKKSGPAPGDSAKTKPSVHTKKFKQMYGEALPKDADAGDYIDDFEKSDAPQFKGKSKEKRKDMAIAAYLSKNEEVELDEKITALVNKAKKSGMPYSILKKVYDRGMAAYKTGHRPGATPQQWALARVNSFTTKSSGTWGKADKDLAKQVEMVEKIEEDGPCWDTHKQVGMKKKGGKMVPNCVPKNEDLNEWGEVEEAAEYKGRKVTLNKPTKGDVKKSKVYVKNEKGNVVKVEFGDPNMQIQKDIPARRKSFRARHNCDNPGPKWKARYWSCKAW